VPKQVAILNDFSGGLNNLKNARDISNNQLHDIQNMMVDMQGGMGITPRFASYSSTVPDIANTVPSTAVGYGLGAFETDFEYTSTSTTIYALGADELNGAGATWWQLGDSAGSATQTGWNTSNSDDFGTSWTLGGNTAVHSTGNTTTLFNDADDGSGRSNLTASANYRIIYTMSGRSAGSVTFKCGNGSASSAISTNATSYVDVVCGTGDLDKIITITPTSDFDGTLDDVEVRVRFGGGAKGGLFFSTTTDSTGDNVNLLTGWTWENSNQSNNNNINLVNSFPVGSWIKISDAYVNQGLVTTLNSGRSVNEGLYHVIGSVAAGSSGSSLYLHKPVTTENNVTATITGLKSTGETLILNADAPTGNIALYTRVNPSKTWAKGDSGSPYANAKIDLRPAPSANYSPASEMLVRYYRANGAIRCCDTVKTNGNVIKWFGLINFTHWKGTGAANPIFGYEEHNNRLEMPTDGHVYPDNDLADATVNSQIEQLDVGAGFSLFIKSSSDAGTYSLSTGQSFEFSQTFIYDGNQESLPSVMTDNTGAAETFDVDDLTDLKALDMRVIARGQSDYNNRITGGRIYIRIKDSGDPWALLVDMDLEQGARTSLDSEWIAWSLGTTTTYNNSTTSNTMYFVGSSAGTLQSHEMSIVTYEVINGFPADVKSNSLGYQMENWSDSVVTNNRAFVCNVQYVETNSSGANTPRNYPDKIMYSMPNRYDTFPEMNFIEAVRGDSDGYVALVEHADRLLAFKERSMQLINISSPNDANWFLEESYKWMGVLHPEAVKETPYGIIWMNPYGLYLYSGGGIRNLIEDTIDPSFYKSLVTSSSILGYDPIKAHIILQFNTHASATKGAIFDLKKNTYVKMAGLILGTYTNMIVNPNDGYLFYGVKDSTSTDFNYYDSTDRSLSSALNSITFTTKDIDFGDPSSIKKVYKVIITYKSSGSLISNLKYYINSIIPAYGSASTFDTGVADAASDWEIGTFEINNGVVCQSFGLIFESTGTTLTSLDINDISIEYRVIRGRKVVAT
tara:strand:+ start:1269 stop:4334 length:3066 start_codon:yes stop_codon:yes gene_type:complete